jgi:G3E family GTPase
MDELQSIHSQHEESNHRHREIQKKYHLPPTPTRPTTGSTMSSTSSRHSQSHSNHHHHQHQHHSSSAVPMKTPIKSSGSVESKDSSAPSSENSKEFLQVEKNFKDARDTIRLLTQKLGTSNPKNI